MAAPLTGKETLGETSVSLSCRMGTAFLSLPLVPAEHMLLSTPCRAKPPAKRLAGHWL